MGDVTARPSGAGFTKRVVNIFYAQTMLIILILLVIVMSISSGSFLSLGNLFNVVRQFSVHGILAVGMTIVIIGKGMDLSAASILALCAVANVMLQPYGYGVSIAASLAVGAACGLLNGYLIARVKANFIIVTLGTQIVFTGVALIISGGRNMRSRPEPAFHWLGEASILGVPVLGWFLVAIMVISGVIVARSIAGRRLYAVGLNDRAARASGINDARIVLLTYVINGLICGAASVLLTSRLPRIRVGTASDYLFDVITIVVLGGTALSGGVGGIYRTAIGLLIFAIINNGMALLHIPFEYQQLVKGIILILAVLYDEFNRRRRLGSA
jgi:ribose/xylose/arabinose/galactoside ABC-type transport system permease subunit